MKILFIEPHAYIPQLYGGVQTSTDQLCRALMTRGHKVAVLAHIRHGGWFAVTALLKMKINAALHGCKIAKDKGLGYPVWRAWNLEDVVTHVIAKEKPDLIVTMTGKIVPVALVAQRTKIPLVMQLNDVAFHAHGGNFRDLGPVTCIANSQFTAMKYHQAFGVESTVIFPFVSPALYKTKSTLNNVTFINPVPEKGRDIALNIARHCPDIPYVFVEALPLTSNDDVVFRHALGKLSNVTLLPPQSDMRKIYSTTKILLAPSICEEAFGRVASEAQMSGIPVIASRRGGLPEAVGAGGLLVDPEAPIEDWVSAVRTLWNDERTYAELSAAALTHTARQEIDFTYQIDAYEKALLDACGQNKGGH